MKTIALYVKVLEPNKEALLIEIEKAYSGRSLAYILEWFKRVHPEIKISKATLARIKNGQAILRDEIIEALAEFAKSENVDTDVTVDSLARANGMKLRDSQETKDEVLRNRRDRVLHDENQMCRILKVAVENRGYKIVIQKGNIRKPFDERFTLQKSDVFIRQYNYRFAVSGVAAYDSWCFAMFPTVLEEDASQTSVVAAAAYCIDRFASAFASDSIESDRYEREKYSFIFFDRRIYERFVKMTSSIKLNGLMSAILLNQRNDTFIEETQLEREDGERESSVLSKTVLYEEKEDRDDWHKYDPFDIEE